MKRAFLCLAIVTGLGVLSTGLRSQDSAADAATAAAPAPITPIPSGPPLQMLKAIRDANIKLLEQQAATLQKLEEMEKTSQTMKVLGKRS